MNVYVYCADLYCEDCGERIRAELTKAGLAPAKPRDEYSYDSDDFPKGPFNNGGGESDVPHHCAEGGECINAIKLRDESLIGAFLENPLTEAGYAYLQDCTEDDAEGINEAVEIWREHYGV